MGFDAEVVVVGGGIVGLSTAYAISRADPGVRVIVLEKETGLAAHQTGRNSGVVHSGLYYRPGSLKARFAVEGGRELAAFCREHGLPYRETGKLVLATTSAELPRLHALAQRGREHGLPVRELGPAGMAEYEPHVAGIAALHVGSTGICDYPAVAAAYAALSGAQLRTGNTVTGIARRADGVTVGTTLAEVRARVLVNCAGLHSDRIARLAGDEPGVRIVPFRGEYVELAPRARELVRGLVYPVPDPAFPFLGVHLTRDLHGGVHAGPNAVPALAREGYDWRAISPRDLAGTLGWPGAWRLGARHWRAETAELHRSLSRRAFAREVQRLLPDCAEADLRPAPAGVRAQAVGRDGSLLDDFAFAEAPRTVHVLNAPSPAATASLPIGREVARRALTALAAA
ncbi:L-2-hydroxyglutarate oxidase [Streptacidiphilus sp. PB12-B1b]|uniref:L-2-hydroxyglutarate oxidase n=1 Tax=Streptacidiphilus sp. PB12-B1b TaxID=2705012 RepID=UPI0015FB8C1E|nr:L-2-hydroxyglutarate oxidase [Streptacidiphilus sp. PB12-B1b]QMU79663.1 L-2-hydroxyglutarate oxidase [Streptacidiphilus sp. PB12-B1b]